MISNRQLQKVTKSKSVFPTDDSLLKMLYLVMMDITKKWTGRRQDWSMIHAQMAVYFADRMPEYRRPCRRSRVCAPPERRRFDERRTSAALDIRPRQRYVVDKAATVYAAAALKIFALFSTTLRCLHRIWDGPLTKRNLHLSDQTVSKWKHGAGSPDLSRLPACPDLLDIALENLLYMEFTSLYTYAP